MKMKKLLFPILFLGIALMGIISCEKVEFTEEDALANQIDLVLLQDSLELNALLFADSLEAVRDSLADRYGVIQYTIKVMDGSQAGILKSANTTLDGVSVSVTQHGQTVIATTVNGVAIFDDMRIGTVNVKVSADDFTELNYVAEIPNTGTSTWYSRDKNIANMVTIFPLTGESLATITGQATIDTDLTNAAPEIAANVLITATIDVDDNDFRTRFVNNYNHTDQPAGYFADIVQMAYSSLVTTVTTDASGLYTIQVPSSGDTDGLDYMIEVGEFATDQTLYMSQRYGEDLTVDQVRQTVRTIFSSEFNTTGEVSQIESIRPVYVTFSAPTGAEFAQPTVAATAVAHIGESGIQGIQIADRGDSYTQAPQVIITSTAGGEGAEATATLENGKVVEIDMVAEGSGYTPGTTTVSLATTVDDVATATAEVGYEVTGITVGNAGAMYAAAPTVTITSAQGSGATAVAQMNGYVSEINVTAGGTGYTAIPNVIITGAGSGATATATMSDFNKIHSISVEGYTVDTFTSAPRVWITSLNEGSGATATASIGTSGGTITAINVVNIGGGYLEAPTVTITGGGGHGAQAWATIGGTGSITGIWLEDGGEGYTSTPTVSITAAPAGGTNATATAVVGRRLSAITITSNGNGFDIASDVEVYLQHTSEDPVTGVWTNAMNTIYDGTTPDVYLDMSVRSVSVTAGGTGYTTVPTISFSPANLEGSGATATAAVSLNIASIDVTNGGSGYNSGIEPIFVNIGIPADGGTQATATAVQGNGVVTGYVITNPGAGYTAAPIVGVTNGDDADTEHATITATVTAGELTALTIDDAGSGYIGTPTLTIKTYESVAVATATVNLTAGQIEWIELTNPGEGYTIVPTIEIIPQDNGSNDVVEFGTGATATAVLDVNSGRLLEIVVDDPGQGYYRAPDVNITIPNYNSVAKGVANVNTEGVVTSVTINDQGNGYVDDATITFTGVNGIGSGAEAIVRIGGGIVQEVIMTDGGSGYTAKNTPGNYFPAGGGTINGKVFTVYGGQTGGTMTVYYGQTYVRDIYLGTGKRVEEY
jgi:hypothetical protein